MTFNDGIVKIYTISNTADEGNMPVEKLALKNTLRYKERVVGMGRFWTAHQANAKIDLLLRVAKIREVSTQDIAIPNDGKQYKIVQIQYPEDLPVMDLSLERVTQDYELD